MDPKLRSKAGHYEILGETHAKYEFFHAGWNPYSRFLDVDKVDLVLRRVGKNGPQYREVQVKFGKLYRVGPAWERRLFDVTSWRFFRADEFAACGSHLFIAYILSEDDAYRGDLFLFPVRDFEGIIRRAPMAGGKHRVYLSRCKESSEQWVLRCANKFEQVGGKSTLDVSKYRRNFGILDRGA